MNHAAFAKVALLLVIGLMALVSGVQGQGWEISFGGSREDRATALVQTRDGGYLTVGVSESFGADLDPDVYAVRTDADGKKLWEYVYDEGIIEQALDVIELENGDFLIVGFIVPNGSAQEDIYLLRINPAGRQVWSKSYGSSVANERGNAIVKAIDGGYVIVGTINRGAQSDILLTKIDANGVQRWTKEYGGSKYDDARAIVAYENGYVFVGATDNLTPGRFDRDIIMYRVNALGDTIWTNRVSTSEREEANDVIITKDKNIVVAGVQNNNGDVYLGKFSGDKSAIWSRRFDGAAGLGDEATAIVELQDGSLVIAGSTESSASNINALVAKFDADGRNVWSSVLGEEEKPETLEDIVATQDGGFAVAGWSQKTLVAIQDLLLIKTDPQGNTKTNYISGQVFFDRDGACDLDSGDPLLKEWLVKVTGGNQTYFGATDENGRYSILVDTGRYHVTVLPASPYWESCIVGGYNINLTNFYDTTSLNFPMTVAQACPYLEVDISTAFLAVCSDVEYTVSYCNLGTATAQNAYLEVTLDDKLTLVSSGVAPSHQNGNTYTFQLGNVLATNCKSFKIKTRLACEGIAQGQATLVKAHIYPDTLCLAPGPQWDGSSLVVSGECQRDSVKFRVKNVGRGNMNQATKAVVIQDILMIYQQPIRLNSGGELVVPVKNTGQTYRLIAEQSKDHPGRSYPTVAIEGCASDGQNISTGFVTQFPEDDQDNFIDTDVQEIFGSITAAAQMRGYPKGYRDSLITANTEITYNIVFKNAGIDTVRRVVIRDTLSPYLDLSTLSIGASSHPYKFELTGNGVLKITFDNIELLPDGSAGGTSNLGYLNFRVSQKPNNTTNTLITNRAAIYFNYDAPVQTNQVRHRVGTFPDFVVDVTPDPLLPNGVTIKVSPNPLTDVAKFEIETDGRIFDELTFTVYDAIGRRVSTQSFSGNQFMYYRHQMTSGIYFYRLESRGQLLNSGKLLVR
jgi:uncharacterized repeat protein (TIGR01451 family)